VWKNVSNCLALLLCFGGQCTATIAMSLNGPLTFIDAASISASSYGSSSKYAIVDLIRIAVPPWAVPSGWFVQQRLYPGMTKWDLEVECVSLMSKMSIWLSVRKSCISLLCWLSPFAFYCAILNMLWVLIRLV
jgi:hypothetical protein